MPTISHLQVIADPTNVLDRSTLVLIGRRSALRATEIPDLAGVDPETWTAMLGRTDPGDRGASATTWVGTRKVVAGVLPEPCSRHNSPSRAWAIPGLAGRARGRHDATVLFVLDDASNANASILAAARAFPLYQAASGKLHEQQVALCCHGADVDAAELQPAVDGIRLAARLVDTPCAELHTDAFVEEAQAVAEQVGAEIEVLRDPELKAQGMGGLVGVGQAATRGPALVALTYRPEGATRHVAWIGKGIVYDTGGLSIKGKNSMPGMKGDMGGAAAVLGAFSAAAARGVDYTITAVLCLAENAVGPDAIRPDDILTMRSGRTVEVNNTDAEGRLVLADGVAWTSATTDADLLIDLATLTGAALVATGKAHAALYCNDEAVEAAAVVAGRGIGEPVHPLVYAPELFRKEFRSPVADMKNSVKDRANAQSSCAGQFIGNHLPKESPPRWLHIDIAGPAWDSNKRGSGYGVGLLLALGAGPDAA